MDSKTIVDRPYSADPRLNQKVALGAAVGPVFFAVAYTILGFLRSGYSQVSEPISGLGVGTYALAMNASFFLLGVMIFVGVIGVFRSMTELGSNSRRVCIILLWLSPIGAVICGLYNFEEFIPHTIGFFLACGTPIICYPIVGILLRRIPRYRSLGGWLIAGGPVTLLLFCWFMDTFDYLHTDTGTAGLIERILILEVHAFYAALGWLAYLRKL
jgi:hypothetical protein